MRDGEFDAGMLSVNVFKQLVFIFLFVDNPCVIYISYPELWWVIMRGGIKSLAFELHILLNQAGLNRKEGWDVPDVYLPLLRKEVWGTPQLDMMSNVI